MSIFASWIHGTSIKPQNEGYYISKTYKGYAAIFHTHGKEWFHFAIPTPVITDNKRVMVKKVFVFYKTELSSKIVSIHVYDGGIKIPDLQFNNLALTGDHSTNLDNANTWQIANKVEMKYGLGISIEVDFGKSSPTGVPGIWFTSAGADFEKP
ncbi:DUF6623 family protein [Methanospirillum stamsii]|uniref:Uncharacterized protein n=1 Tax=Methanospirillum stamsii TaxID=1277351 RepID=A0A2V2MVW9_9EURY|nr:DUF6623 family protein [Methanospirillum stamsii]PWR70440.1 hypothetical protein DLD82_15675 [Methanospirillum stamsii]